MLSQPVNPFIGRQLEILLDAERGPLPFDLSRSESGPALLLENGSSVAGEVSNRSVALAHL